MRLILRVSCFAASVILLLYGAATAFSQGHSYALKGCVELGGSVSYASLTPVERGASGGKTSMLNIAPLAGYFPIEGLEIGLSPGVSTLSVPGGLSAISTEGASESLTLLQFFAFGGYNVRLRESNVVPFGEAMIGYSSQSSGGASASGFSWGLRGGVKLAPVDHFLLALSVQYVVLTYTPENESERSGVNVLLIGISLGGFF
jgi:hypothetical protein